MGTQKIKIDIEKLKPYWKKARDAQTQYSVAIRKIEEEMQKEFNEPLLEFFFFEGEMEGIGTPLNPKRMDLIYTNELD